MGEIKNPFSFGTGDIDKDLWLRDIDNEQEDFITRYGSATNKHRTALLRQAFQDLRTRIANGDMLNRTADGLYQFGSALNREDKHMQEAYQRALGFMGGLARRQIQAPPPEPEKKAIGSLEERYIKSLNPSGKFNTEAYWKNQTDEERRTALKDFLNRELKEADSYQDFGNFGNKDTYTQRLQTVMNLLESGKANDWSLQQLGFTKNWLTLPQQQEEEQPKTRLEQAQENYQAAVADQQAALIEQQLAAMNTPTPQFTSLLSFDPTQYWTYDSYIRGRNKAIEALKYTDENGNQFLKSGVTISRVPGGNGRFTEQRTTRNTAWNGQAAKDARTYAQRQYINGIGNDLSNYFKNLGVNYQSYLGNNTSKNNLMTNLSKLFTLDVEGKFVLPDIIGKLFAKQEDGKYGLRGSTLSYDPVSHTLYNGTNIDTYGEGGIIKGQNGLLVDDSYYVTSSKPSKEQKTEATPNESKQQFSTAENARIAATIADIASMGTAFVPGYGTAASAVLGLGSTATNFGADLADGQGLWDATKNAGFGLAADVMGLIPGLGGVGKGAKIARNLMWAVPKMMQWVNTYQGLLNAGEIKNSIMKLTSPSSMTVQDWLNVSQALQIMTGHGRSVATKVKKAGMSKKTTTTDPEYYIFTNKGKQKVSEDTFKKLREVRGTKARQALTEELVGEGVTLQQTSYAPWNTSTRFGAFKLTPGKTTVEVQNKHKGWFSDENLVEKAENMNPSVDIRSIMHRVNPYRDYYNRRNQPVMPQRNYSSFEARLNGDASPLNVRGPLQPYPTGKKEYGGILKALRNGGIIKAQWGDNSTDWNWTKLNLEKQPTYVDNPYFPEITYNTVLPWYKERWNNASLNSLVDSKKYTNPNLLGRYTGTNLDFAYNKNMAYVRSGLENKQADIQNYFDNSPLMYDGDLKTLTDIYNSDIDKLYNTFNKDLASPDYLKTDASSHNNLFKRVYASRATGKGDINSPDIGWDQNLIGIFGSNSFARRPVNYETKFEDDLKTNLDLARDRVSKIKYNGIEGYVYTDENGRIHPVSPELLKTLGINNKIPGTKEDNNKTLKSTTDKEVGIKTPFTEKLKDPFDPTLLTIAGKTLLGLRGNKDIYGNLLKEMPQAPLRDPIDRKLAIVGWQERIKHGQNELADLRRIQQIQQGSDQQTNFATALEAERVGRDVMDKAFMEDSGRQFETAGKSWNIDNEDTLYNIGVGDANRKSIADRARMMAQIRAAWRSGDNNILMGGLADAGNWLLKRYQREQDVVDRARGIELGTPESRMQERLVTELGDLANKKPSEMTAAEIAKVEATKAKILRQSNKTYASDYYNMFHVPGFGGGYYTTIAKDGTKLEIAKLKARGKDNDRYVSMIKDLRKSSSRRRRRRFYYED